MLVKASSVDVDTEPSVTLSDAAVAVAVVLDPISASFVVVVVVVEEVATYPLSTPSEYCSPPSVSLRS